MNKLEKLLRRWTELEPDRCKVANIRHSLYRVRLKWSDCDYVAEVGDISDYPTLEQCVREAIEARGWKWQLGTSDHRSNRGKYFAEVDSRKDMRDWQLFAGVFGDTALLALLQSYIFVLERNLERNLDADGKENIKVIDSDFAKGLK